MPNNSVFFILLPPSPLIGGRKGTVVLGRRGQSNLAKFSMGRVPSKVIHIARTMTVWIIS
jgi:hypothetical protein